MQRRAPACFSWHGLPHCLPSHEPSANLEATSLAVDGLSCGEGERLATMSAKDVSKGDAPASPTTPSKKKGLFGGGAKDKVLDQVRDPDDAALSGLRQLVKCTAPCDSFWRSCHWVAGLAEGRPVQTGVKQAPSRPGQKAGAKTQEIQRGHHREAGYRYDAALPERALLVDS